MTDTLRILAHPLSERLGVPLETTLKDTALNNCFRDSGKKIVLDLPEGITEVTATHKVNLDTGAVTAHDLTAFDFKPWGRPVDPAAPPKP